jgi:membrane-anchored mycosin MYCP
VFGIGHVDPVRALTGVIATTPPHSRASVDRFAAPEPVIPRTVDTSRIVGLSVIVVGIAVAACMGLYAYLRAGVNNKE